jgi:hypothetical protein
MRLFGSLCLACGAVLVTGCSSPESVDAARVAGEYAKAAKESPATACDLLAPGTREELEKDGDCAQALQQTDPPEAGPLGAVTIASGSAQVHLGDETVFLARFDDGWKVTAAGCTRTSADTAEPYDCDVKGQ